MGEQLTRVLRRGEQLERVLRRGKQLKRVLRRGEPAEVGTKKRKQLKRY
jgi:hypothetical protein